MNNEITVNALIRDNLFRIPIYQRSYVWTEKHWDALWQDITAVAEGNHKHFVGSIIYSREVDEEEELYLVIDGQQRLTTFTLLVAAVCYYLAETQQANAELALRDFKKDYLFKETGDSTETRLRLRPADSNRDFFNKILGPLQLKQPLPNQFNSRESQIYEAFNYFRDKIVKYSYTGKTDDKNAPEQQVNRVANLIVSAFDKMRLIPMKLEEGDDAQRIFECMNYRGQPLEQSDLIRNYVLQRWERPKRVHFHDEYWVKIEQAVKDQYAKNKIDEDKVPDFFRDFLSMSESKSIKERDIFHTFKTGGRYDCTEKGKPSPDKMERILHNIRRFAGYYGRILNSRKTEPNKVFDEQVLCHLWYVNQLPQASTTYPFLLRLLDDYAERKIIDKDTLIACLEIVQSYIVRCTFCNRGRKAFNKIFPPLYRRVFSKSEYWEDKTDNSAECLKNGIAGESYVEYIQRGFGTRTPDEMFPSNADLEKEYLTFNLYRNNTFCKYILLRLEEKMSGKKGDTVPNAKVTIEHVYPQHPNANWVHSDGGLTHTIGNLTLTTQNSEMGNRSFAEKRSICFIHSGLKLNKYFADLDPRIKWDEKKIRERAAELFKLMKKIWLDILPQCRENVEPEDLPIKEIETEDFWNGNFGQSNKPTKISYVVFGKIKIDGKKYAGKKPKGSWKKDENDLQPANKTPDGEFYNNILRCLYADHEGSFENTPLGARVRLEKIDDDSICFIVPHEIIEDSNGNVAVQTKYAEMWQNIKQAAEETGELEKLRIRFAD